MTIKSESIYALVDCNNFYVSCERLFNPNLRGVPVIVLSNNDGVIVARSNEAKALGIKMAEPFFKAKEIVSKHHVRVFASNYTLYGDISGRVFATLRQFCPQMEVYSIDEAFLNFCGCDYLDGAEDLTAYARRIRAGVKQWTGIEVSIGVASTKTLAKLANHLAKKSTRAGGVLNLLNSPYLERALARVSVGSIWGVGRRSAPRLEAKGICNALDFRNADPESVQKIMGLPGRQILRELAGMECHDLQHMAPSKKSISSTRSFGRSVESLEELKRAVATFVTTAAGKLREQESTAGRVTIFLRTNTFREDEKQYCNSINIDLPVATSDTGEIIRFAHRGLARIFRSGFRYRKAGIILTKITPIDQAQADLFQSRQAGRKRRLMEVVDELNAGLGRHTISFAAEGIDSEFRLRPANRTPSYTTRWDELLIVKAGD